MPKVAGEFWNEKLGKSAQELSAYRSESEEDAKRRLEAGGWSFNGVSYTFNDSDMKFYTDKIDTKKERQKAFPSEAGKDE